MPTYTFAYHVPTLSTLRYLVLPCGILWYLVVFSMTPGAWGAGRGKGYHNSKCYKVRGQEALAVR